ncbi:hypothetical protein TWF506_000407 [Arthrobotrys conoides]|uniref:Uncharacterized protein n=1 Tax=Arthrobotrys conoides TaxID=74498 RepID=A0AAN8P044_9PEZI
MACNPYINSQAKARDFVPVDQPVTSENSLGFIILFVDATHNQFLTKKIRFRCHRMLSPNDSSHFAHTAIIYPTMSLQYPYYYYFLGENHIKHKKPTLPCKPGLSKLIHISSGIVGLG